MKWIKASNQLPTKRVIVRWSNTSGGPYIEIGDGEWIKTYQKGGSFAPDSLEDIEWLNEESGEEIKELASRNMAALISKYSLKTPEDQKTVAQLSVELAWELVAALNK